MSLSTRRKPLSNNTDFNTGKTFNTNNTATSKTNSESRNIELKAKKSKTNNSNINTDNNNNTDPTELPSSSSSSSSSPSSSSPSNVPKNGANTNLTRMNRSNILDSEKKKLNSQNTTKKNRKCKKTPNDPNSKAETPLGDPSTTHEKECFLNHNEPHKNAAVANNNICNNGPPRKGIRPVERERMRDWLSRHLNADSIRGLYWIDKKKRIFRIPWKHGSSQNWTEDDAELFVEWAKHTGRYYPDTDTNKGKLNTKRFKATFRCALNSLPDCQELANLNNKAGSNAFKVYQFSCDKETCPYKKKKSASKSLDTCCGKSVECDGEEMTNQEDASPEDDNSSQQSDQEETPNTPVNDKIPPSNEEETPPKLPEKETPLVAPEASVNCIPCQENFEPDPCRTRSSFDDLTISENDVANTLLELQRGAVSRLIKKELFQLQPQIIHTPPQSQTVPITHLPVSHMLQSQIPITPHTQAQIYSQPVLRPKIAKSVLQPQTTPVHVLQSQLTTHREIHPKTQAITYEQTSTMTVVNPVSSKMPSVIPFVPAMVLPYTTPQSHSEHQMTNVCMIPALVPTSATQMMHIHSSSFDNQTHQFVPVAAVSQNLPVAAAPQRLPVAAVPQSLSAAAASQRLPVATAPQSQRLPAAAAPQRLPSTAVQQRLPAAGAPQRLPSTAAPQRLPVTTASQRLHAAPPNLPVASPRLRAMSQQFSTVPQRLPSAPPGLPTTLARLPVPSPRLPTTTPRLPTTTPRLPTTTPRLPTAPPRLPTAPPRLQTTNPKLSTAPARLPTITPRLPTTTPRLPTTTPRLPTAPPRLPTASVHAPLPETQVFSIKQEVLDADYSPLEINNNSTTHNNNNNNNNNSNITVKLENVLTGDLTSGYKVSEQKQRKDNQSSTNVVGSGFQTNNTQVSNRKRTKGKKNATGPSHDAISNVQITSSSQNYQKKRKK